MKKFFALALCGAVGLIAALPSAHAQQKTVKACREEWRAKKAADPTFKTLQKDYVPGCRKPAAAAPAKPAAPAATAPAAAPARQRQLLLPDKQLRFLRPQHPNKRRRLPLRPPVQTSIPLKLRPRPAVPQIPSFMSI